MIDRRLPLTALLGLSLVAVAGCQPKVRDLPGPGQAWKQMDHEEREVYMAQAVLPHMQATFAGFDAERFASFDCTTCHPSSAAQGEFVMPDPALPKLSRWHFRREHMKPHPETVRFMWEQVEPQMSALLGGPKGLRGFNCRSCHTLR